MGKLALLFISSHFTLTFLYSYIIYYRKLGVSAKMVQKRRQPPFTATAFTHFLFFYQSCYISTLTYWKFLLVFFFGVLYLFLYLVQYSVELLDLVLSDVLFVAVCQKLLYRFQFLYEFCYPIYDLKQSLVFVCLLLFLLCQFSVP